jgi:excisionase family DNA binding protein
MQISKNNPYNLDVPALAKELNTPISWIYRQTRQGKIPFIRFGKYCRFNLDQVLEALQVQTDEKRVAKQ